MPELLNRDELESDFAKKFGRAARRHMFEFRELLGDPPDITNVPEDFFTMCRRENEHDLYLILFLIFSASAEQHGWTGPDMRLAAFGFANERAKEVADAWDASTRRMFGEKLDRAREQAKKPAIDIPGHREENRFIETPGQIPQEQVDEILDSLYGPKRVHQWVVDETTRARHEGAESAIESTVGLSDEDVWVTEDDSSVCPTCRPLNDKPRSYWSRFFPEGPPTPHSFCRCYIRYHAALELVGASKSFNPDEPRDSRGRWTDGDAGINPFLQNNPIVNAMRRIESGADNGALVSIRELRKESGLDESTFDSLMSALSKLGVISLHTHDYPSSLTDKERAELLVLPGDGGMSWNGNLYFVGAAIRQSGPHKKGLPC